MKIRPLFFASCILSLCVSAVAQAPNILTAREKSVGWHLLFDGATSKGWRSVRSRNFPSTGWEMKDGLLSVTEHGGEEGGNAGDIITTRKYANFELSVDFRVTPGANSGILYFVDVSLPAGHEGRGSNIGFEYQILDDALHPDARLGRNGDRTLASVYDMIKAEKQSRFIHQPGHWNTGRVIVYPNNHVEHYLNGIKVLEYERGSQAFRDLVAISKYKIWPGFGEAKQGHILLQDHGNEVSFRSIKIRVLK